MDSYAKYVLNIPNCCGDRSLVKMGREIKECNIKDVQQPNLYYPTKASVIRTYFWKEYKKRGIIFILKKYANDNIFRKSEVTVNKVFFSIIYKCKERINICRKGKK